MHAFDLAQLRWQRKEEPKPEEDFSQADFCHRAGAMAIKARIEEYWLERGYKVEVYLNEAPFSSAMRSGRVDVRSDMISGFPRAALPSKEKRP